MNRLNELLSWNLESSANTPLSSNAHFKMSGPKSIARWRKCSRKSQDAPKHWANKRATLRIVSLTFLSALSKPDDSRLAPNRQCAH